jgi:hypothetical protein
VPEKKHSWMKRFEEIMKEDRTPGEDEDETAEDEANKGICDEEISTCLEEEEEDAFVEELDTVDELDIAEELDLTELVSLVDTGELELRVEELLVLVELPSLVEVEELEFSVVELLLLVLVLALATWDNEDDACNDDRVDDNLEELELKKLRHGPD